MDSSVARPRRPLELPVRTGSPYEPFAALTRWHVAVMLATVTLALLLLFARGDDVAFATPALVDDGSVGLHLDSAAPAGFTIPTGSIRDPYREFIRPICKEFNVCDKGGG